MEFMKKAQAPSETMELEALSIESAISADEAYDELMELSTEVRSDIHDANDAAFAATMISGTTQAAQAVTGKEDITVADVAALAVESNKQMVEMFGGEMEAELSTEDVHASPAASLTMSNEGAKEFLEKVYKAAKLIVAKIVNKLKKLIVKVVVVMDGTNKKAAALLKTVKGSKAAKPSSKLFSESEAKTIIKRGYSPFIIVRPTSTELATGNDIKSYGKNVNTNLTKVLTVVDKYREAFNTADDRATLNKFTTTVTELKEGAEKELGGYVAGLEDDAFISLYSVGSTVRVATFSLPNSDKDATDDEILDSIAKFKIAGKTVKLDVFDDIDADKLAVVSKADLESTLGDIVTSSKDIKKFSDARMKEIGKLEKEMDQYAKDSSGSALKNKFAGNAINISRTLVTSLYLDAILAYVSVNRNLLASAKLTASKYTGSSTM